MLERIKRASTAHCSIVQYSTQPPVLLYVLLYTNLHYTSITSSLYFFTLHIHHFFCTIIYITHPSILLYATLHYTSIISSIHHSMLHTLRFFYTLLNITLSSPLPSLLLYIALPYTFITSSLHYSTFHAHHLYTLFNITLPSLTLHTTRNFTPISCFSRSLYIALHYTSLAETLSKS